MPKVIAYAPTAADQDALDRFLIGRDYEVDEYTGSIEEVKDRLWADDVLILTSIFDLGQDQFTGFAKLAELTDDKKVTVVTVKENFVLRNDVGSHAMAGIYFLTKMIENTTGPQEPNNGGTRK